MILSRANKEHQCISCTKTINKGDQYLNMLNYHGHASKFCIDCLTLEVVTQ